MWETTELGSEDLLWASTAFNGGIAAQREASCGALSSAAVYLGLKYRVPLKNGEQALKAKETARLAAAQLVRQFRAAHGDIICKNLVGIDFNDPVIVQQYRESGSWITKCSGLVQDVIARLYELEKKS